MENRREVNQNNVQGGFRLFNSSCCGQHGGIWSGLFRPNRRFFTAFMEQQPSVDESLHKLRLKVKRIWSNGQLVMVISNDAERLPLSPDDLDFNRAKAVFWVKEEVTDVYFSRRKQAN